MEAYISGKQGPGTGWPQRSVCQLLALGCKQDVGGLRNENPNQRLGDFGAGGAGHGVP